MKIEKIQNKLNLEEQFDVQLQGCSDDCLSASMRTSWEADKIAAQGVNVINPNSSEIKKIARISHDLDMPPCFYNGTAKWSIFN